MECLYFLNECAQARYILSNRTQYDQFEIAPPIRALFKNLFTQVQQQVIGIFQLTKKTTQSLRKWLLTNLAGRFCVTSVWEYHSTLFLTIDCMWCNSPLCYNPIGMCMNPFSRCQPVLKQTQVFTLPCSEKAKADYAQRESLTSHGIVCRTDLFHIFSNDFGNESWYSLCHTSKWARTNVVMLIWLGHLPGLQK